MYLCMSVCVCVCVCVRAVVGDFSLHLKETSAPKKRAARLNYLSLPLAESGSEYRLTLPYLLLSIIYENMQR